LRKFQTRIGVACIATIVAAQVACCGRAAAFFVMNEFSTGGFTAAVAATNALIAQLAPR
jgi:hypothetical protein